LAAVTCRSDATCLEQRDGAAVGARAELLELALEVVPVLSVKATYTRFDTCRTMYGAHVSHTCRPADDAQLHDGPVPTISRAAVASARGRAQLRPQRKQSCPVANAHEPAEADGQGLLGKAESTRLGSQHSTSVP
jgi:hypothetical protein